MKTINAISKVIATLLPPEVAYWAFLRVAAKVASKSPQRDPQEFTVGEVAEAWLRMRAWPTTQPR